MGDIQQLLDMGRAVQGLLLITALASIRLKVALAVLPATDEEFLPGGSRNAVVLLLGLYIAFGQRIDLTELDGLRLAGLALKEAAIGFVIGFAASTVFWVAEAAGAMIDTQAGFNNVQLQNPLSGQQSTPVSSLMLQLVVAVFFALGGLLVLIRIVHESFIVWPLMSPLPSLDGASQVFFLKEIDRMMMLIVKFAAPVLLVLVLIDLSFGLITRAADKLEPQSLSQPVKGAVTMLLLALMTGVIVTQVSQFLLPGDLLQKLSALLPKG